MSEILNGKIINEKIAKTLIQKIKKFDLKPKLVIIQIGNNEESNTYIKHKKQFAEKIGAVVQHKKYEENVSQELLIQDIKKYNQDQAIHGIIIQLPIPEYIMKSSVIEAIDPSKDVDGLTASSIKKLFDDEQTFMSAAAAATLVVLDEQQINLEGKKVTVVGQSTLVGKPIALALMNRNATVTVCNIFTENLAEHTKQADIVIVGVGKPNLITEAHISPHQTIIDIGITVLPNEGQNLTLKKVVGDVDYSNVVEKVKAITPVPGGIGPVTVACLFQNVVEACILQSKL